MEDFCGTPGVALHAGVWDKILTHLEETFGRQDGAGMLCRRQQYVTRWGSAAAAGLAVRGHTALPWAPCSNQRREVTPRLWALGAPPEGSRFLTSTILHHCRGSSRRLLEGQLRSGGHAVPFEGSVGRLEGTHLSETESLTYRMAQLRHHRASAWRQNQRDPRAPP